MPLMLEDVIAEIENSLGDLTLIEPELKQMRQDTLCFKQGFYIQYQINQNETNRVFYLGNEAKKIKRAYHLWARNWMV